ncbi:MAG TPA: hypothetical protein VFQ53_17910 [Kofleriaceae bacterium]|nr:hypothetical protein [Kofleriaceae bacterium]
MPEYGSPARLCITVGPYEREAILERTGATALSETASAGPVEPPEPRRARKPSARWLGLAVFAVVGGIAIWIVTGGADPPTASLTPPSFTLPERPHPIAPTRPVRHTP